MSAGPLETYNGTTGVADNGGDSLTEDLNIYYSVCSCAPQRPFDTRIKNFRELISEFSP